MLAYKYSTCQGKIEENLEVIGGAGVRGKLEGRNQRLEIGKQEKGGRNRGQG